MVPSGGSALAATTVIIRTVGLPQICAELF
jgi:hypothetical protein